jgi:hypothetical protein
MEYAFLRAGISLGVRAPKVASRYAVKLVWPTAKTLRSVRNLYAFFCEGLPTVLLENLFRPEPGYLRYSHLVVALRG